MDNVDNQPLKKSKYSAQFWLVIMFEFFERGAYYGMMSFLSVYFSDTLLIPKENVGVIKGVIQPLLYFLPILSGAIADRFGYRKMLLIAFSLLGGGYFLTSQMTEYTYVFIALVIMGVGAGIFKPIISGTIARVTDESNSTQAFGIFYWSINLGAFLFPLVLVPVLKSMNPSYVIIAAGICTSAMIIPTLLFFKDPELKQKVDKREQKSLIQTLANAFEIIYSPLVLTSNLLKRKSARLPILLIILLLFGFSINSYLGQQKSENLFPKIGAAGENNTILFNVNRNMLKENSFKIAELKDNKASSHEVTVYKPDSVLKDPSPLLEKIREIEGFASVDESKIAEWIKLSLSKIKISVTYDDKLNDLYRIDKTDQLVSILLKKGEPKVSEAELLKELKRDSLLLGISEKDINALYGSLETRPFFLLFVMLVIITALLILAVKRRAQPANVDNIRSAGTGFLKIIKLAVPFVIALVWVLPGLTMLGRIISTVLALSVMSLFVIQTDEEKKFKQHAKFLLMILLYSIFWVLYFQMFDSVLWYVQAYVDAAALNSAINGFLGLFGIKANWFFDVEHVTVINAGTIIILQLFISRIVKNMKALPTMVTGIAIATVGMGILAISTHIWIFILGIFLFSIGEMTAHPKFISYVGLTAPEDNKALYMGYIFLYGVFGSSVGGIVGAKLYVHFVDNLNNPSLLWLIFSGIGVIAIVGLLLYNKFLMPGNTDGALEKNS